MMDDRDKAGAIEALASSKGGKIIMRGLMKDIVTTVDFIATKYNSLTHTDFIAAGADLSNKLTMYRVFVNSRKNKRYIQKLLEESFASEGDDDEPLKSDPQG